MTRQTVVLIGCVEFSRRIFEAVAALPDIRIEAVVTRAASPLNADFVSPEGPAKGSEHTRLPCGGAR